MRILVDLFNSNIKYKRNTMTKFNFLSFVLLAVLLPGMVIAQPRMLAFPDPTGATDPRDNFYLNYVGSRVKINSPASVEGPIDHTISNNGSGGSTQWGGDIGASPINDVEIVKAVPFNGCGALTNASAMNGKVALIERGDCEFGAKALAAENAGAVAVIIFNNIPNAPAIQMGEGAQGQSVSIPAIMISNQDGLALAAATAPRVTMREWSNGFNNDIGFVDRGVSLFHANTIPLNQLGGSSSNVLKGFDGAVIANYGSQTANSIKVAATVSWTPGTPGSITGTPTVVHTDTIDITTPFAPSDSIITPIFDNPYTLNPTSTGRYDVEYVLIPDFTDDFPEDNKAGYSFYVDNRVYSKSRFDFSNNAPLAGYGTTFADDNATLMTGPMYYIEKGGYALEKVKFVLYNPGDDTATSMSDKGSVDVAIYKWVDQNSDEIMVSGECEMVGFGTYNFKAGDVEGMTYTVDVKDPLDVFKETVVESNTWYWATVSAPSGSIWTGFDGILNYFPRSWGRVKSSTPVREPFSPAFNGNYDGYNNSAANTPPSLYPFDYNAFNFTGDMEDSVRFSLQKRGMTASLSMQMSLFPVNVDDVEHESIYDVSIFPNPASDVLNITLNLDEQADEVRYNVFTMLGGTVKQDIHNNVKTDNYSINTADLAAGTYYLNISVDGVSQVRKFTVIK